MPYHGGQQLLPKELIGGKLRRKSRERDPSWTHCQVTVRRNYGGTFGGEGKG